MGEQQVPFESATVDAMAEVDLAWLILQDGTFPAGRFVHSNGLEAWLAAHPDAGEREIAELSRSWMAESVATLDAVVLAWVWREPDRARELDRLLRAHKPALIGRVASEGLGRQLAAVVTQVLPEAAADSYLADVGAGLAPGNAAVVEAVVQRLLHIPLRRAILGFLRSAQSGFLSAAVRLGRLGPLAAQRVLLADRVLVAQLVSRASAASVDDIHATVPELEVYAMRHERASARLFTS